MKIEFPSKKQESSKNKKKAKTQVHGQLSGKKCKCGLKDMEDWTRK
jgi:hypothetical protein